MDRCTKSKVEFRVGKGVLKVVVRFHMRRGRGRESVHLQTKESDFILEKLL